MSTVQQKARSLPKQSVAVTAGLFSGSFFTYGPPSIANTQLETLGLTNAFSDDSPLKTHLTHLRR